MAEIWDLVDKVGNKIGIQIDRKDRGKIPEGCFLPCAEVWIRVGDDILLTVRHPEKSEGGRLECPGGGVLAGEDFIDGALRELFEEVGIIAERESLAFLGDEYIGDVYAVSYLLMLGSMPRLNLRQDEVSGYRLARKDSLPKIKDLLTEGTYRRYVKYREKICG